jgi:hypothetical protein
MVDGGRDDFEGLPQLRVRLLRQIVNEPILVIFRLESADDIVEEDEALDMGDLLGADCVTESLVSEVPWYPGAWISYRQKWVGRPPDP